MHGLTGARVLMRIYIGKRDRHHGKPLAEALGYLLRERHFAGRMSHTMTTNSTVQETRLSKAFEVMNGVPNACQIQPNLITGGQPSAQQLRALKDAGGDIVLDLRDPMEARPVDEAALVNQLGMEYVNIPVRAGSLEDPTLERILTVLRGAGDRTVFLHCSSGNRVGGALIPYFILDQGMEEEAAVDQAMRVGLRSAEMLDWGLDYARRNQKPSET